MKLLVVWNFARGLSGSFSLGGRRRRFGRSHSSLKYHIVRFADIACIPWALRFDALEHHRSFQIPNTKEYAKFNQWVQICSSRDSIRRTRKIKEAHVENHYIRI